MGFETLAIMSLAMSAVGTIVQNAALSDAQDAEAANAQAEIDELQRQREQTDEIAQEKKADRVREADQQFASMIAALADNGGAGTVNEARFAGEIGGYEGIDLARIEGNRLREVEAIHSRQTARAARSQDRVDQLSGQRTANTISFFSSAVGTGLKVRSHQARVEAAKQGT